MRVMSGCRDSSLTDVIQLMLQWSRGASLRMRGGAGHLGPAPSVKTSEASGEENSSSSVHLLVKLVSWQKPDHRYLNEPVCY